MNALDGSVQFADEGCVNERQIKSYVWHKEKCFFVSTIERDSSAAQGPRRYNETIVWDYDWDKRDRGEMLGTFEDFAGAIETHLRITQVLFATGKTPEQ